MIRKNLLRGIAIIMCAGLMLSGCGENASTGETGKGESVTSCEPEQLKQEAVVDAESNRVDITGDFAITTDVSGGVSQDGNVYTITAAGDYTFSGKLPDGQIIVDAGDEAEVNIILNGASISCSTAAPVYVVSADSVKIKSEEETFNEISDTRAVKSENDTNGSEDGNAAIYSCVDLSLTGKGSLVVNATYNNGIQSKKDVSVKNVTLKITAPNNALKGNDSVEIESGEIVLDSTAGDGIKTEDSDVSSKGNQRGIITITGGNIDITAASDGLDAAYDVCISDDANLCISAKDDGIHAENVVTIDGGVINVETSYEGIEGNNIVINDGKIFVYATDDGLNASSGATTPLIKITGGYVDVTTPSGDTDAIDSNGNYEQTGGFVFVKGGSSSGRMSGSIDTDGSVTVTGGTVVALGGVCETPVNSCNAYVLSGTSFTAGSYTVADGSGNNVISFDLTKNYSSGWICSDTLGTGTTYTISRDGTKVAEWTQTEGTMGAVSNGFGGGMSPGGKNQGGNMNQGESMPDGSMNPGGMVKPGRDRMQSQ
ncbi:MAG: carbohydrate-binding domain-containing protein [Lachnospira sp.]